MVAEDAKRDSEIQLNGVRSWFVRWITRCLYGSTSVCFRICWGCWRLACWSLWECYFHGYPPQNTQKKPEQNQGSRFDESLLLRAFSASWSLLEAAGVWLSVGTKSRDFHKSRVFHATNSTFPQFPAIDTKRAELETLVSYLIHKIFSPFFTFCGLVDCRGALGFGQISCIHRRTNESAQSHQKRKPVPPENSFFINHVVHHQKTIVHLDPSKDCLC